MRGTGGVGALCGGDDQWRARGISVDTIKKNGFVDLLRIITDFGIFGNRIRTAIGTQESPFPPANSACLVKGFAIEREMRAFGGKIIACENSGSEQRAGDLRRLR